MMFRRSWIDSLVDDGAVFYVNGAEVLRLRMPSGAVNASTLASSVVTDATWEIGNLIPAKSLVSGKNVLAAEVHQTKANDSDMTFDASLSSSVVNKAQGEANYDLVLKNDVASDIVFELRRKFDCARRLRSSRASRRE